MGYVIAKFHSFLNVTLNHNFIFNVPLHFLVHSFICLIIIYLQLFDIKYSYIIQIICTQIVSSIPTNY